MIHNYITEKKLIFIKDLINNNNRIDYIINNVKKYTSLTYFLTLIKNDNELFCNFLIKCNIEPLLFITIRNIIIKNNKGNYSRTYCVEYILILIFPIRNEISIWKGLTKSIFYNPIDNNNKYHYKSIHTQYCRWCHCNIYYNAFNSIEPIKKLNESNDKFFFACYNGK